MNSKLGAAVAALVLVTAAGPAAAAIEAGEAASPVGAAVPVTKAGGGTPTPAMVMPAAGILRGDLASPVPQGRHPGTSSDDAPSLGTLTPVPEPGNWAMIVAGVLGVGAIARRRVSR